MPTSQPLVTRKKLASDISERYFPVSPRQISTWHELKYHHVGREALYNHSEGLAAAEARLRNAPVIAQ